MPTTNQLVNTQHGLEDLRAEWPVLPTEASVKQTRDRVSAELRAWGLPLTDDKAFEIALIVSELVTNALVHAPRHDIHFAMRIHKPGQLVVEVRDRSARTPGRSRPAATDEDTTGRGMTLVEGLAIGWGVSHPSSGKSVCATIAVPVAPSETAHAV